MNKNVWILNHYALTPDMVGGTRHYALSARLIDFGWTPTIFASSSQLNAGQLQSQQQKPVVERDYDGVKFRWIGTNSYSGNGLGRLLNMMGYSIRVLMPNATKGLSKPAVVVGSSVHPFAAASGALLARRFKVPFVFEIRDLWPQTLIDMGVIQESSLVARLMRFVEKQLLKCSDKIVILLPGAQKYIADVGGDPKKVVWIPNGVVLSDWPVLVPPRSRDGEVTIAYFGAHGVANGLHVALAAMKILKDRPDCAGIKLKLIGDGSAKPALIEQAAREGLANVEFVDPIPKSDVPGVAAGVDAFLFTLIDCPVFNYGISSNKLFEYLASERPIIFSCAATNNPVEDANAGITVKPDDAVALADAMIKLRDIGAADRKRMGQAGRVYVLKNHDFKSLGEKLSVVLTSLVVPDQA